MTDQEIWNTYYMNKPTDTGNWKPDELQDDDFTPAWNLLLSILLFAVLALATVALVKGCA